MVYIKNGNILRQADSSIEILDTLPVKVYLLQEDRRNDELFLEEFAETFEFNFKIYGLESKFISHVMDTFHRTTNNLGILLNGVKGTGKTITAKILANRMELPVIIVNNPYNGLAEFIAKINGDCILLFDEYEKNFPKEESDTDILAIMDGVMNSPYRRIFLLTTNTPTINRNMIGRPSRIRYIKSFNNLSIEVVKEYLEDNLKNKDYIPSIIEYINTLAISTIDILKAIVEELNIHDLPIDDWKEFFNVESAKYHYDCATSLITGDDLNEDNEPYSVKDFEKDYQLIGKEDIVKGERKIVTMEDVQIHQRTVSINCPATYLHVGDEFGPYGRIISPLNEDSILVTEDRCDRWYIKILNLDWKPTLYQHII
jgi:SpoVK/Ycf46/Vps4 family AAA+-type ATPase